MNQLLLKLDACEDAKIWAKGKTWPEIYDTCYRGDWLLWLFKKTNIGDLKLLTLAKGHCANTVRHLMKDPRSIAATDAAIAFGNGEIDRAALDLAFKNASAAYVTAYATARQENRLLTANIVRKYIPRELWNITETGELINN